MSHVRSFTGVLVGVEIPPPRPPECLRAEKAGLYLSCRNILSVTVSKELCAQGFKLKAGSLVIWHLDSFCIEALSVDSTRILNFMTNIDIISNFSCKLMWKSFVGHCKELIFKIYFSYRKTILRNVNYMNGQDVTIIAICLIIGFVNSLPWLLPFDVVFICCQPK